MGTNITEQKYIGVLVGGITAEVLGSQSEGMTPQQITTRFGRVKSMPIGKRYTDDGEMTLVLARHLAKNGSVKCQELHAEFGAILGGRGYSQNTRKILQLFKDRPGIGAWLAPGNSSHNGSVMRISPIGLMDWNSVQTMSAVRKAIYYTHGESDDACYSSFLHCRLINALVTSRYKTKHDYFRYMMDHARRHAPLWAKMNLVRYCLNSPVQNITAELLGDENVFQIKAIDAISCAVYIFFRFYEEPVEAVIYAASLGGDTDTIAKLVGDLCGALHGIKWIPSEWSKCEGEEEFTMLAQKLCVTK